MADNSFSIDIGEKYLKIADVSVKGNQIEATTFAYTAVPVNIFVTEGEKQEQLVAASVEKLLLDGSVKKKNVNIVIPDSHSYSRIIEMPFLTEKELVSAIRYQADQFVPIPIEKVSLDIEILATDKKNKKLVVLIVAAPTSIIEKITHLAESIGLVPETIENEASAILRLVSRIYGEQRKNTDVAKTTLFVNFGYSSTSLYLYDTVADEPIDVHNFQIGQEIFLRGISANYNKNEAEVKNLLETIGFSTHTGPVNLSEVLSTSYNEIVSEINKFILSSKSKFNLTVSEAFLFGEGFKTLALTNKLTTSLGIKTQLLDLGSYFIKNNVIDFFNKELPIFTAAVGGNLR